MHFHQAIEDRLRNELKYKIVIAIDPCVNGLIYYNEDFDVRKLFLKFLLKLLNEMNIEMDDNIKYTIRYFKQHLRKINSHMIISDLDKIESYHQFLEYFSNKLETDNLFNDCYHAFIRKPIYNYFKYGFNLEESKQILSIYQEFIIEFNMPQKIQFLICADVCRLYSMY